MANKNNWKRRDVLKTLGSAVPLSLTNFVEQKKNSFLLESNNQNQFRFQKPIRVVTIGAGARGNLYGDYALIHPDQMKVVGVAEPIPLRNDKHAQKHGIEESYRFDSWEQVFQIPRFADAVVIATPDDLHYAPCMKALEMGYDILLEKPISPSETECLDILRLAKETGRIVAVCHVLRYSPYWIKIKDMIQNGVLGEIISLQHLEPIGNIHMSHSYVRGNWHNSKETTPIILAKSCHDLDIIKWLVDKSSQRIQAFGDLKWFRKENAPEGSTARCMDGCAVEGTCPYSALRIYHRNRQWTHVLDLPADKNLHESHILEKLRNTNYGRCVYRMDNDQPDHYVCNIQFEGGATVAFSMEAHTSYEGRRTRIMGSKGDITGDMRSFVHNDFSTGKTETWTQENTDGHGGGDFRMVSDWLKAIAQQDSTLLSSTIDVSIESHLMGFAAEKSRETGKVVDIM
jgi:predicted dehydrogenase